MKPRRQGILLLATASLAAPLHAACGEALAIDDDVPSSAAEGGAGQLDAPGAIDGDLPLDAPQDVKPACPTKLAVIPVSADTGPSANMCDGAIGYGVRSYANLSPNVGLLLTRFILPAEVATAIRGGDARAMRLTLTANPTCSGSCNVPTTSGTLQVHTLRNDWDEGTSDANYSGADKCRRTSGETAGRAWGIDRDAEATGASAPIMQGIDYRDAVGTGTFPDGATGVSIPLAPEQVALDWKVLAPAAGENAISFYVFGVAGNFVAAENGTAPNSAAATLSVEYCIPDGG